MISTYYRYLPISISNIRSNIAQFFKEDDGDKKAIGDFLTKIPRVSAPESVLSYSEWKDFQKLILENQTSPLFQFLDQELCSMCLLSVDMENFEKNKKRLQLLSSEEFERDGVITHRILSNLYENRLLTASTLNKALSATTISKPITLSESTVQKISRKTSLNKHSQIIINDGDKKEQYFIEHKEKKSREYNLFRYPRGAFGIVKMLYASDKLDEPPTHVLKKSILNTLSLPEVEKFFEEGAITKLMDDQTKIFKRKIINKEDDEDEEDEESINYRAYILQTYIPGKPLSDFTRKNLEEHKYIKRLEWLENPLSTLIKLHDLSYVHLDIKFNNLKLDLTKNKMHLFDFGSARSFAQHFYKVGTQEFRPDNYYDVIIPFSLDIYGMGLIAAFLFPELYDFSKMDMSGKYQATQRKKSDLSNEEKAITHLINAMLEENHRERCTAKDALDFINGLREILQKDPTGLTDEALATLLEKTINRYKLTEYDAFHDNTRPRFFLNKLELATENPGEPEKKPEKEYTTEVEKTASFRKK